MPTCEGCRNFKFAGDESGLGECSLKRSFKRTYSNSNADSCPFDSFYPK